MKYAQGGIVASGLGPIFVGEQTVTPGALRCGLKNQGSYCLLDWRHPGDHQILATRWSR